MNILMVIRLKRMVMEEISDLDKLRETDSLLIIFTQNNKGLVYKLIKDDYYINIFDDVVYIFDRSLELKGRFDKSFVEKFVRVSKE